MDTINKNKILEIILSVIPKVKVPWESISPVGFIYSCGRFEFFGNPLELTEHTSTRLGNCVVMTDGYTTWGKI